MLLMTKEEGNRVMETPIYTKLEAFYRKGRPSFAMPGHKNLRGLAPGLQKCDVTELAATVDLHHESDEVKRANELLSGLYGSKRSFIMTCGSTAGIQVMLSSVLKPGDTLLADADCHISVINTCAVCGFKIKLIPVRYNKEFFVPGGVGKICPEDDIKAVILTSPNYYGIIKNVRHAADICHAAGIPLLIDEAHGAHFAGDSAFPKSAVGLGADMVCQSAHKTLNALTGAAYLHVCGNMVDIKRVRRALASFQTSSPSYPIAASADIARAELAESRYSAIIDECGQFRDAISRFTKIRVLENDDITRIVLNFSAYDVTGFEVSKRLSDYFGIDVEMADCFNIVLIATPWNRHSDFADLFSALKDITDMLPPRSAMPEISPPPVTDGVIAPSAGWFADTEPVEPDAAEGRISAVSVTAYPPGIPIIITGAVISAGQIEYIKLLTRFGAEITGMDDNRIEVVK